MYQIVVKEMKVLLWLSLCGVGYGLSIISVSLVNYLLQVDGDACVKCDNKSNCFGHKTVWKLQCVNMYEFILLSFWKERKYCRHISLKHSCNYISMLIIVGMLEGILFWSKGLECKVVLYGISIVMLWSVCIVDWYTQYIPFEYTSIIFLCGLIRLATDTSNWLDYILGLFMVSGFLYITNKVATPILRKRYEDDTLSNVIGDGDVKLMAATGLLLGWKLNFLALGIGCVVGSIIQTILMKIKESDRQFALGPYLSLGVYITMICGEQLVSWYLNMIGFVPM